MGHTMESFKALAGKWVDVRGPTYDVTEDTSDVGVASYTVVARKRNGETTTFASVIRFGPSWSAGKITWGKTYVLEVQTSSRSYVRWVHVENSKLDFVWTRTGLARNDPSIPPTVPSARVAARGVASPVLRNVNISARPPPRESAWGRKDLPHAVKPGLPPAEPGVSEPGVSEDTLGTPAELGVCEPGLSQDTIGAPVEPGVCEPGVSEDTIGTLAELGVCEPGVSDDTIGTPAEPRVCELGLSEDTFVKRKTSCSTSTSITSCSSSSSGDAHSADVYRLVRPCPLLAATPSKAHPGMLPAEAELVPQAELAPQAKTECDTLKVGDAVLAHFYGAWYDARVHRILGVELEVLWQSEWCTSRVPLSEVVLLIDSRPASSAAGCR